MKNIIKVFLFSIIALAFAGCDKPGNGETTPNLNQNLDFTLEVASIEGTTVKINVTHNGESTDSWYGFETTDVKANEGTLIAAKVNEMKENGKVTTRKNAKITITLRDLQENTDYKYIVFGVTADGTVYGNVVSTTFKTDSDATAVYASEYFDIEYLGRLTSEETGTTGETFQINNPEKRRFYFTTFNDYYLQYYKIEDIIKGEIEYVKNELSTYYNLDMYSYTDEVVVLQDQRQQSGSYTAIAIELDEKGNATRYYSSSPYKIEEEAAEEGYTSWLGTWELTDANDVKQSITFEHADNNFFVYVRNWEAGEGYDERPFGEDIPFSVFQFPAYYEEGDLVFKSLAITDVTYNTSDYGYFGMYGTATYDGVTIPVCINDERFAIATMSSETEAEITGLKTQLTDMDFTYESMGYAGFWYTDNGNNYKAIGWYDPMEFPIRMVKTAGPETQQQCMEIIKDPTSVKKIEKRNFTRL